MYPSLLLTLLALGASAGQGQRIADAARSRLEHRFEGDCSGFALEVLKQAGAHLRIPDEAKTGSQGLHLVTQPTKRPRPGDLAFFHDTTDRNHNGRLDDPWTHVAIVEAVEGSTVTLIHRGGHGVARLRIDLARRHDPRRNSWLRVKRAGDPPGTRYLAGELLAGFGRVPQAAQPD